MKIKANVQLDINIDDEVWKTNPLTKEDFLRGVEAEITELLQYELSTDGECKVRATCNAEYVD